VNTVAREFYKKKLIEGQVKNKEEEYSLESNTLQVLYLELFTTEGKTAVSPAWQGHSCYVHHCCARIYWWAAFLMKASVWVMGPVLCGCETSLI